MSSSEISFSPFMQACPFLRTNDVIVHGDVERAGESIIAFRYLDVRLRQRGIARKVIVTAGM
jgi:hypothetical protein